MMKFPGGGSMQQLLGQAQKMQAQMKEAQEKMNDEKMDFESAGGRIRLSMSGKQEILSLEIDAEIVDPSDTEMLADMIKVAINEASESVQKTVADEMSKHVPPGMAGMF